MSSLKLTFSSGNSPELIRTHFSHPLLSAPRICSRGRTEIAHLAQGTFQWRPAVHALCLLLVKASLDSSREAPLYLEGGQNSPASSIEYCLRKLPSWILEMFGTSKNGTPLARRLLSCSNASRRVSDVVHVAIAKSVRDELAIEIFIEGTPLQSDERKHDLLQVLKQQWRPHRINPSRTARSFVLRKKIQDPPRRYELSIREIVRREVQTVLRSTDIFRPSTYKQHLARINGNACHARYVGKNKKLESRIERELLPGDQLGYFDDELYLRSKLCSDRPIKIILAAIPSAIALIYQYLIEVKGYNIQINFDFLHAGEIVNYINEMRFTTAPDVVTLGVPSAARVLNGPVARDFEPFAILPRHSVRLIGRGVRRSSDLRSLLRRRPVLAGCDHPTSGMFYLTALEEAGLTNTKEISLQNADPLEIFNCMNEKSSDAIAVSYFPHFEFNRLFNDCQFLDSAYHDLTLVDSFALAHKSFMSDKPRAYCLLRAIRNAWLELRDGGPVFECQIDSMLRNPHFREKIAQSAGFDLQTKLNQAETLETPLAS